MLAVDTNVIVRLATADDPAQHARAEKLVAENHVWVGATVVLETEWVLRSVYRYASEEVCAAIRAIAGLPRVEVEEPAAVERALQWHAAGMDFADAMHWAGAKSCDAYVTFDEPCIRAGTRLGLPVRAP